MYVVDFNLEDCIKHCFQKLDASFNHERSFHIILGLATIKWINVNEDYQMIRRNLHRANDRNAFLLRDQLMSCEEKNEEITRLLLDILKDVLLYEDRAANESIQDVWWMMENLGLDELNEVKAFINKISFFYQEQYDSEAIPESVRAFLAGLTELKELNSFAVLGAGLSYFAVELYEQAKLSQLDNRFFYYGEELNVTNCLISKLLMKVNEISNFEIVNRGTFSERGREGEKQFDLVISDIPQIMFEDRQLEGDPRFKYGIPSRNSADWAFCQDVIYHMNSTGKGIVIGTKGTLVRSQDAEIREKILRSDLIECVITLPMKLYGKANVGTEIVIFNKCKVEERKNRVLFMNASECGYRYKRNQYGISEEGMEKIHTYYKFWIEEEGFSKFVGLEKIEELNFALNPVEYLEVGVLENSFGESIPLGKIAQISRGVQSKKDDISKINEENTHYFINIKDIEKGKIYYDDNSMVMCKREEWIGKYDIQPDDIIITSKGSSVKVAIVEGANPPAFISSNLTRIRVDSDKYNAYVLYEFFQSEVGIKMIKGIQTGTTITLLNNAKLQKLKVPLYDLAVMNEVGAKLEENKKEYEKSIKLAEKKFRENRKRLLGKLALN